MKPSESKKTETLAEIKKVLKGLLQQCSDLDLVEDKHMVEAKILSHASIIDQIVQEAWLRGYNAGYRSATPSTSGAKAVEAESSKLTETKKDLERSNLASSLQSNPIIPPNPTIDSELELYEKVEKLFKLKISSQGVFIGIKYAGEKRYHWVTYESFLKLRKSIENLIAREVLEGRGALQEISDLGESDVHRDEYAEKCYEIADKYLATLQSKKEQIL